MKWEGGGYLKYLWQGKILARFPAKKKHRFLGGSIDFLGRSMEFDNIFCTFQFEIYIWHVRKHSMKVLKSRPVLARPFPSECAMG